VGFAEEFDEFGDRHAGEAFGHDVSRGDAVEPFAAGRHYVDCHEPLERFAVSAASDFRA
jgi:hypothetical protein